MLTLASMRSLVRTLTAVTATDILTDALLNQLLNESLYEIYRRQGAGWPFAQTALSADGSTPPFDAQFHMAVVYRTAAKVLTFVADTSPRGQVFMAEYEGLVNDMDKFYLSKLVDPTDRQLNTISSGLEIIGRMSLTDIISTVRGLTGVFDKQMLSDGMLDEIINTAATELYNLRDWKIDNSLAGAQFYSPWVFDPVDGLWIEDTQVGPSHVILYRDSGHEDTAASRQNVPYEVRVIFDNGINRRAIRTDSLWDVGDGVEEFFYTFSTDVYNQTVLHVAPKLPVGARILTVASGPNYGRISETYSAGPPPTTAYTFLNFPVQFQMLVPYRAAQFVLMQTSPDDQRIEYYGTMYGTLLSSLINFAELDHDARSFSIGERGKDSPRYVPWFRPS